MLLSALAAACAGTEADGPTIAPQAQERFAIATLAWSSARAGNGATAQAYFVEHAPGERAALIDFLHVPGASVAFDAGIPVDSCVVTHPAAPSAAVLLDAGELTVESADGEAILESSYIPDGYMQVAGLAYEGVIDLDPTTSRFELVADGSDEVGPFSVTLNAPPTVKLVAVAGESVVRGRVSVDLGALAEEMQGLAVAWEAPESPYEGLLAEDVAVVTYERRGFGDEWTVACAVKDDGRFTIPAAALHNLPDLGADATDRIIVRRVAGASFAATGISDGLALAIAEDAAYVE